MAAESPDPGRELNRRTRNDQLASGTLCLLVMSFYMEIVLRALDGAGLSQEDAVRTYFVLMTFGLSQVKYRMTNSSNSVSQ